MTEWVYGIISVIIVATIIGITKAIEKVKLEELQDSQKILGIVAILAITGEIVYLSVAFGLLQFALETITSIGVGIIFLGVAFQNKLKNAIAGISIAINPKINIKDSVEVENVKGKIIQFGLTKTTVILEDGSKVMIPNVKFDEEIIKITSHKKQKNSNS